MNKLSACLGAAMFVFGALPLAQSTGDDAIRPGAPAQQLAQAPVLADGEVRKVHKDTKTMVIKHGPIPSLDMPAMVMVFHVKDPAMLEQVKAGDKIRFQAEKIGGAYTVIRIEASK